MNWYLMALKRYVDFRGRSRRKEYWMFSLFQFIFIVLVMILDNVLGLTFGILPYGFLYVAYVLGTFLPGLAVSVRRLHDTGRSGWWLLIAIIPLIGAIWLLVLDCMDSQPGENKWGPNPKGASSFNSEALDSHLTNN